MPRFDPRPVVAVLALALVASATVSEAAAADRPRDDAYRPPVDAAVVDGFRPPATPFGAGNRGLEYATVPGAPVVASGAGRVAFAGPVAGRLVVTIDHPDRLRTTYSGLGSIAVSAGDLVAAGQRIGRTGTTLHFGVRAGTAYLDPLVLFGGGPVRVWLVPSPAETAGLADTSWYEFTHWGDDDGTPFGRLGRAVGWVGRRLDLGRGLVIEMTVDGLVGVVDEFGRTVVMTLQELQSWWTRAQIVAELLEEWSPRQIAVRLLAGYLEYREAQDGCTGAGVAVPRLRERRIVVFVGGLGSDDSQAGRFDPTGLGYDPGDVVHFAYGGGKVAGTGTNFGIRDGAYDPADTGQDLRRSASELRDLLASVRRRAPGVPVDVVGHSAGGVVARLALAEDPDAAGTVLVTLGTPHQGADLATQVVGIGTTTIGGIVLAVDEQFGVLAVPAASPAVGQLAEHSSLVAELRRDGLPPGVRLRSVAAREDLLVASRQSRVRDGENVVISEGSHTSLPSEPAALREIGLAVNGMGPTCRSLRDHLVDQFVGEAVSLGTDAIGVAITAGLEYVDPTGGLTSGPNPRPTPEPRPHPRAVR